MYNSTHGPPPPPRGDASGRGGARPPPLKVTLGPRGGVGTPPYGWRFVGGSRSRNWSLDPGDEVATPQHHASSYSNKLSMIDDDEDMPPLLSAFDFDDEAMEWNAMDFDDDA